MFLKPADPKYLDKCPVCKTGDRKIYALFGRKRIVCTNHECLYGFSGSEKLLARKLLKNKGMF